MSVRGICGSHNAFVCISFGDWDDIREEVLPEGQLRLPMNLMRGWCTLADNRRIEGCMYSRR